MFIIMQSTVSVIISLIDCLFTHFNDDNPAKIFHNYT